MADSQKAPEDQLHDYVRGTMTLWVQWFVFFLTVNYVALGWFAGELAKNTITRPFPLICVAILFVVQGMLGIRVSWIWQGWFRSLSLRVSGCKTEPHKLYAASVLLGMAALVAVILLWTVLALWGALGARCSTIGPRRDGLTISLRANPATWLCPASALPPTASAVGSLPATASSHVLDQLPSNVLRLPSVEGQFADPHLSDQLNDRHTHLGLL
jgi:hypothetical protein